MRIFLAVLVRLFTCAGAKGDDDALVMLFEDAPAEQIKVAGYTCKTRTECPFGLRLVKADLSLKGCVAGCTGDCQYCTGSPTTVKICVKGGVDCFVSASFGYAECGTIRTSPCFTGTAPNTDVNGCWCNTPAGPATSSICLVAFCN